MTTELPKIDTTSFDSAFPSRKAGMLPSVRTEYILAEALAGVEETDPAKFHLNHIWGHYQSLELMLNSADNSPETIVGLLEHNGVKLADLTPEQIVAATLRAISTEVLDLACHVAHHAGAYAEENGITVLDAFRVGYAQLDFTEDAPEDSFATFLRSLGIEDDDESTVMDMEPIVADEDKKD